MSVTVTDLDTVTVMDTIISHHNCTSQAGAWYVGNSMTLTQCSSATQYTDYTLRLQVLKSLKVHSTLPVLCWCSLCVLQ